MNFNLASFLSGSLRILNIANKTLPLIKEASPAINNLKNKYKSIKKQPLNQSVKELEYKDKNKKREDTPNGNLPTFFK